MHYHVHVLRGAGREFVRGPTLVLVRGDAGSKDGRWEIWDDADGSGEERAVSEPLELAEALRRALERLVRRETEPIWPLLDAAPFELLGYRRPRRTGRFLFLFPKYERLSEDVNRVGPDGLPAPVQAAPR